MSCRRPSLSGPACAWTPHGYYLWGGSSSLGSCRREVRAQHQTAIRDSTPDFSSRLSPEIFSTSGYFRVRVFPLLGELLKAIEPHLPVCQLYRWQLGPNMWSSPTTKSLDPIVATALKVGFPGESHRPATCGLTCNCPKPEAWTTEASWHTYIHIYTYTQYIKKKTYTYIKIHHIHAYIHIYIHTHIYIYTHTHIHTYIYTHKHTHLCSRIYIISLYSNKIWLNI